MKLGTTNAKSRAPQALILTTILDGSHELKETALGKNDVKNLDKRKFCLHRECLIFFQQKFSRSKKLNSQ